MEDFAQFPDQPVLVIGAAGVDIVGRLREELHPASSTPAFIRTSFGGVSRNVAENLAHLGQPVTLLTVVGEDPTGEQLLSSTRLRQGWMWTRCCAQHSIPPAPTWQ